MKRLTLRISTSFNGEIMDIRELKHNIWDEEKLHKLIQDVLEEYEDISSITIEFIPEDE